MIDQIYDWLAAGEHWANTVAAVVLGCLGLYVIICCWNYIRDALKL